MTDRIVPIVEALAAFSTLRRLSVRATGAFIAVVARYSAHTLAMASVSIALSCLRSVNATCAFFSSINHSDLLEY